MHDSWSWAQGSSFYEQLKPVDDMNDFGYELKALNAMGSVVLWMTWMTLGRELKTLKAKNTSEL